ncbi:hypothetical protein BH23BAC3_BH23BAC3_33130 [soil metagenome]
MKHVYFFIGIAFLTSLLMTACGILNEDESEGGFGLETPGYPFTYWEPSVSADGEVIVFHRTKVTQLDASGAFQIDYDSTGIWTVRPDGTGLELLMTGDLHTPVLSPDGKWLAYEAGAHIFKAPFDGQTVDTTGIVQLTEEGRNFSPAWSPDGEWIAYDRSFASPEPITVMGTWIINTDSAVKKKISSYRSNSAWLPDGQHLFFVQASEGRFFKVNVKDTSFVENVAFVQEVATNTIRYPKYSPDGSKIAFQSQAQGEAGKIWVMNSDGTNPEPVADHAGYPSWTSDGRIVYVHGSPRPWDNIVEDYGAIWIMNADGSGKQQLTFNHGMQWTQ